MTEIEKKLWRRLKKYRFVFRFVPFVRMVGVCNSLAFGKADNESDIDLFVVARRRRMFIVRTFMMFWFQLLGVRRHGNKIAGRFCLSFFVDEEAMDLGRIALKDDIYLANWVKKMVIVADDGLTASRFLASNLWINSYFEEEIEQLEKADFMVKIGRNGGLSARLLEGKFGDYLEKWLGIWQLKRARAKMAQLPGDNGIIVNGQMLKFHNFELRPKYRQLWLQLFGKETKITDDRFSALRIDF